MKRRSWLKWLPWLAVVLLPALVLSVQASGETIRWSTLSGGGGSASSTSYRLGGTLGQGQPVGLSSSPGFSLGSGFWYGVTASTLSTLPGDLNRDGRVDRADLEIVVAAFGTSPPADLRADVNGDGQVDVRDVAEVALYFGDIL